MASEADVRARLQRAGQSHLLRFWAELDPGPRAALLAELALLDPDTLREHCASAAEACARAPGPTPGLAERLRPLSSKSVGSVCRDDPETRRRWEEEGGRRGGLVAGGALGWLAYCSRRKLLVLHPCVPSRWPLHSPPRPGFRQIALNKVAVLLLAGGQGTRLGVTYPKGMYQVGLPSGKTLYQLQAERIRRVEQLAGERHGTRCTVPWCVLLPTRPHLVLPRLCLRQAPEGGSPMSLPARYIMTSEFTLGPTAKFFNEHGFFHLDPANVVLFEQRMLPAVTFDGKAILERKDKVAMAPGRPPRDGVPNQELRVRRSQDV